MTSYEAVKDNERCKQSVINERTVDLHSLRSSILSEWKSIGILNEPL